jgi:hypothetical protein
MNAHARVPEGFERVELRTLSEIESFERKMNKKFSSEAAQHNDSEEVFFGKMKDKARSDLRQAMQQMSPAGRAFAEFAIAFNNQRPRKTSEVGFHLNILHYDSANREPYRPGRGYKPHRGT